MYGYIFYVCSVSENKSAVYIKVCHLQLFPYPIFIVTAPFRSSNHVHSTDNVTFVISNLHVYKTNTFSDRNFSFFFSSFICLFIYS